MFAARRAQRTSKPLASSVVGIAIVAITGMQLMSTLDGTIVVVALPRIQSELALSDAAKSWVITAYVLTFGGLLLLGGRVGVDHQVDAVHVDAAGGDVGGDHDSHGP